MPLPIYFIVSPTATIGPYDQGLSAERFESVEALTALDDLEPGVVLVHRGSVDDTDLITIAERVAGAGAGWILAVVDGDEDPVMRTLGFGLPNTPGDVAALAASPEDAKGVLMELKGVLAEVARVRHDLNNPLTSALAEVQLLLLVLEVIQSQLRRMRDLIASTTHLRPPRP